MYKDKWNKQEWVYAYSFLSVREGRVGEGREKMGRGERRQGEKDRERVLSRIVHLGCGSSEA